MKSLTNICQLLSKKYIADNNIQLHTINAIDKAIEIGMGKRTNTILAVRISSNLQTSCQSMKLLST